MRRLLHLSRRFFESLTARSLEPAEQDRVAAWLRPDEADLFWQQQRIDRRHAYQGAAFVARVAPERVDLIRAALLHDVGKVHSSLGIPARVIASALSMTGIRPGGRFRAYLDHGKLGAADLAAHSAEPIVVAFAAGHHGPCPAGVDPDDWALLRQADGE